VAVVSVAETEVEVILVVEILEVHHLVVDDQVHVQVIEILEKHKCLVLLVQNVESLVKFLFDQLVTNLFTVHTVFQSIRKMVLITLEEMTEEVKEEMSDQEVQQIVLQADHHLTELLDLKLITQQSLI
jgi:hypothetical protein